LGNCNWGREVHDAIARRDVLMLRRMATDADRKETSMWLRLLARMLEVDAARSRRHGARPRPLATPHRPAA
jgi:hypothetical protein